MTPRQLVTALRDRLAARLWGGTGDKVFGTVVATVADPIALVGRATLPYVTLRPAGWTADAEHPELLSELRVRLTIVAAVSGHRFGESGLLGGPMQAAAGPAGRGLLELEEQVFATVRQLAPPDGVRLRASIGSAAEVAAVEETAVVQESIEVVALGTTLVT